MSQPSTVTSDLSVIESSKSLLIAGCGYLGIVVARQWLDAGGRVWALTRSKERALQFEALGIQPIVGHLEQTNGLPQVPVTDAVVWAVGFDRSCGDARHSVWIEGLERFVRAIPVSPPNRRFIYVSSTGVYGDDDGRDVDENTVPQPCTESGLTCLQAEQQLRLALSHHHSGMTATILRMAGIYGPDRLLRRVKDLVDQVPITGEPEEWLNLIHVDDAATMVTYAARNHCMTIPVLNVANHNTLTRHQYYSTLAELAGTPEPAFATPTVHTCGAASPPATSTMQRSRQSSGNKRVTSAYRSTLPNLRFRYDHIPDGISDAFVRSSR